VEDVQEAAYAGSTTSGIRCGKRAGARIVVGVLTGGHTRDRLREAGATHFITRLTEFPALLAGAGTDAPAAGAPQARTTEVGGRPEAAASADDVA
jgi:phosphoglycolate phosphatase